MFIDLTDVYDTTCASSTRDWLLKEVRLSWITGVLEPEDSADEDSVGEVEGLADEKEDDTKTDGDESCPTDHEDTKEDNMRTDKEESSHSESEKDDPKPDEEDEKDDDSKTDEHEAITNDHHGDTKEEESGGHESHGDENETSVFGDIDNEFEVEYDAGEVVVVISACSDDPVSFQARSTQAQMDMMTILLYQPPQRWDVFSYNKEQSRGSAPWENIVAVIMYDQGLDLQGAMDYAAQMCKDVIQRFESNGVTQKW
ncbi:hypothetical protein F4604DRAFT_1927223 [Suillus subluteus]|nr:hypothetical protein F4604DRAFT_1927223 [Suillus subluteus]